MSRMKVGFYFGQIHEALDRMVNNELRPFGITASQSRTLMNICMSPGEEATMKELEAAQKVAQPTMVGIVNRLEKNGFVETRTDEKDRRVKRVKLTEAGREWCRDGQRHMDRMDEVLLTGLSEKEVKELVRLLEKVSANLTKEEEKRA